jgi:hypothetical protein
MSLGNPLSPKSSCTWHINQNYYAFLETTCLWRLLNKTGVKKIENVVPFALQQSSLSRVLLEKLTATQLVKIFPAQWTLKVDILLTALFYCFESCTGWIHSTFKFPLLSLFQRMRPNTRLCVTFRHTSGLVPVTVVDLPAQHPKLNYQVPLCVHDCLFNTLTPTIPIWKFSFLHQIYVSNVWIW